ncbi:MAG: type II toxin-antitoxin system RelB family antitoxin [Methylococcales bacterium]
MITIDLPKTIENRLDEATQKFGKTKQFFIQEALIEYLDDFEDLAIATHRMQSFNPEDAISHEEIMRRFSVD